MEDDVLVYEFASVYDIKIIVVRFRALPVDALELRRESDIDGRHLRSR